MRSMPKDCFGMVLEGFCEIDMGVNGVRGLVLEFGRM